MAQRPLVVIENSVIDSLMADPAVATLFSSCFASIVVKQGNCSKCQKKNVAGYAAAKECLLNQPTAARERLKALLGAQEVRITVLRNGETRDFTF